MKLPDEDELEQFERNMSERYEDIEEVDWPESDTDWVLLLNEVMKPKINKDD